MLRRDQNHRQGSLILHYPLRKHHLQNHDMIKDIEGEEDLEEEVKDEAKGLNSTTPSSLHVINQGT